MPGSAPRRPAVVQAVVGQPWEWVAAADGHGRFADSTVEDGRIARLYLHEDTHLVAKTIGAAD